MEKINFMFLQGGYLSSDLEKNFKKEIMRHRWPKRKKVMHWTGEIFEALETGKKRKIEQGPESEIDQKSQLHLKNLLRVSG